MSCYEWERGTLKIPTAAWKPLRDGLAKAFNNLQVSRYDLALETHAFLKSEKSKAKRGTYVFRTALAELHRLNPSLGRRLERLDFLDSHSLQETLLSKDGLTLLMPKKKAFPLAVATKTVAYAADLARIRLTPASHEVLWNVGENNHAVESSRSSPMGQALFQLLGEITWTRGSGGTIVGNDEYNRDDESEGGGANRVNERFGPPEKRAASARAGLRR